MIQVHKNTIYNKKIYKDIIKGTYFKNSKKVVMPNARAIIQVFNSLNIHFAIFAWAFIECKTFHLVFEDV